MKIHDKITKGVLTMLFDTHVHLNAEQFDDDLEEVIARAQEARCS